MNRKLHLVMLVIAVLLWSLSRAVPVFSDDAPAPEPKNPDLIRLDFLGGRLSSDEASISALNKALVHAGYSAAQAAQAADGAQVVRRQMDFNGGAPVRWQDFYGATAQDFVGVHRPKTVFNYVYRGQNNLIQQAQSQVAALAQTKDVLLAERRKLEADQSALWAKIAFFAIENRDISTRSIYRYKLEDAGTRNNDNAPQHNSRVDFIRAAVLYMRTLDHTTGALVDKLETNQFIAYRALRDTLKGIQENVESDGNDFADSSPDVSDVDKVNGIVTETKIVREYCENICEAYPQAMDRDQAGDETAKLQLRALLQKSLLGLSSAGVKLDDSIVQLARSWAISPDAGVPSPDQPIQPIMPAPAATAPVSASFQAETPPSVATNAPAAPSQPEAAPADAAGAPAESTQFGTGSGPSQLPPTESHGSLVIELGHQVRMDLILIPAGTFTMGSNRGNENPVHRVTISRAFCMGKYPVTQEQWFAVMGDNPSRFVGPSNPVESVSWNDAQGFLKRLSQKQAPLIFSLPTEAQWEYACRAGTRTQHFFDHLGGKAEDYGWCWQNSGRKTHPVRQRKPNPWGLYDMYGNVWEFCRDFYGPYESANAVNPLGPAEGSMCVIRGGAWTSNVAQMYSARRGNSPVDQHANNLGFRLVCENARG